MKNNNTTYNIKNWGEIKVGETYHVYELEMLRNMDAGDSLGWGSVDLEYEENGYPQGLVITWKFTDREIEALKEEDENGYVTNEEELDEFVYEKYGKRLNDLEGIVTSVEIIDVM